jgi:hypothetical protein
MQLQFDYTKGLTINMVANETQVIFVNGVPVTFAAEDGAWPDRLHIKIGVETVDAKTEVRPGLYGGLEFYVPTV